MTNLRLFLASFSVACATYAITFALSAFILGMLIVDGGAGVNSTSWELHDTYAIVFKCTVVFAVGFSVGGLGRLASSSLPALVCFLLLLLISSSLFPHFLYAKFGEDSFWIQYGYFILGLIGWGGGFLMRIRTKQNKLGSKIN